MLLRQAQDDQLSNGLDAWRSYCSPVDRLPCDSDFGSVSLHVYHVRIRLLPGVLVVSEDLAVRYAVLLAGL